MPMPLSGAARPSFRVLNSEPRMTTDLQPLDHLADGAYGSIRPQKVPSRPRKTSKPVM